MKLLTGLPTPKGLLPAAPTDTVEVREEWTISKDGNCSIVYLLKGRPIREWHGFCPVVFVDWWNLPEWMKPVKGIK